VREVLKAATSEKKDARADQRPALKPKALAYLED
jgi:hypothetical protein